MKRLVMAAALPLAALAGAQAQDITITPGASTPSLRGAPGQFVGHAVIDPLFPANDSNQHSTGLVNFAPGARTVWHTHPAGQLLIVTAGRGWVQQEGQVRREIRSGDVVWIPADVRHWHGASEHNGMSHIALTYLRNGSGVTWLEPVTEAQYRAE